MTFAGMSMCEFCLNEHPPTGNKKIPVRGAATLLSGLEEQEQQIRGKRTYFGGTSGKHQEDYLHKRELVECSRLASGGNEKVGDPGRETLGAFLTGLEVKGVPCRDAVALEGSQKRPLDTVAQSGNGCYRLAAFSL